jgi:hypothetical protein
VIGGRWEALEEDVWLRGRRWVAKLEGNGWLHWGEMGGYVGGRWAAKLVTRLLATGALRVRIQTQHL